MTPNDMPGQIVKISAVSPDVLEALTDGLDASGVRSGKVKQTARVGELGLDPIAIAMTAYEIMVVITKIGGAIQLADWILNKVGSFKSPKDAITITVGDKAITITGVDDIEALRRLLGVDAPAKTAK